VGLPFIQLDEEMSEEASKSQVVNSVSDVREENEASQGEYICHLEDCQKVFTD
jgi:hypothetical protein